MRKYYDSFGDYEDMRGQFEPSSYGYGQGARAARKAFNATFPTEEEIIFAAYGGGGYDGYSIVLFERDGKLYINEASHCSCYGLEDGWDPDETDWPTVAIMALSSYDFDSYTRDAFRNLCDERVAQIN